MASEESGRDGLEVLRRHFGQVVAAARQHQEAQRTLELERIFDAAELASDESRRRSREKLAALADLIAAHRSNCRSLTARLNAEIAALGRRPARARKTQLVDEFVPVLRHRIEEQVQALRLREEWLAATRELLLLVERHTERIQFDADGPVFEDLDLIEKWAGLTDRIGQIVARQKDVAAQQRLRLFEDAHRLGVPIG